MPSGNAPLFLGRQLFDASHRPLWCIPYSFLGCVCAKSTILGADVYSGHQSSLLLLPFWSIFLNFMLAQQLLSWSFLTKQGSADRYDPCNGYLLCNWFSKQRPSHSSPRQLRLQVAQGYQLLWWQYSCYDPFFYAGFWTPFSTQAEEASLTLIGRSLASFLQHLHLWHLVVFYLICIHAFGTMIDLAREFVVSVPALAVLEFINLSHCNAHHCNAWTSGPMNSFFSTRLMLALVVRRCSRGIRKRSTLSLAHPDCKHVHGWPDPCWSIPGRNMLGSSDQRCFSGFIFACTKAGACLRLRQTEPDLPLSPKVTCVSAVSPCCNFCWQHHHRSDGSFLSVLQH